jgi:tetratricopeptide (TPR) repeat protein
LTPRPQIMSFPAALLTLLLLCTTVGVAADGTLDDVVASLADARYDDARAALDAWSAREPDAPELQLWGQRLTTDADRALELATSQARDRNLPSHQRVAAVVDGASIALAADDLVAAWSLIEPLVSQTNAILPGEVYLLAGQTLNQAGEPQRAREMLASVRTDDPHFPTARSLLGRIGLEVGDTDLALNYFESALRRVEDHSQPDLVAGRWRALQLLGRRDEAARVYDDLVGRFPTSLAAMEVRGHQRRDDEELASAIDTLGTTAPEVLEPRSAASYAVQLAAFRDRALALQFVQRWQAELADLRIEREDDELGQPVYKVRTGRFVSDAQARTEVARLRREHNLEGFVAGGAVH